MGSFSMFHSMIVLAMLAGIGLLIRKLVSKTKPDGTPAGRNAPTEQRLAELAGLRANNLISKEEFERKRAEIIRDH